MTSIFEPMNRLMDMNSTFYNRMLNGWMIGMGASSWTKDQSAYYYKNALDRVQLATAENVKAMEGAFKQMKDSQLQLYKIIMESIGAAASDTQMPDIDYLSTWNKLITDMTAKTVNSMSGLSSQAMKSASDLTSQVTKN